MSYSHQIIRTAITTHRRKDTMKTKKQDVRRTKEETLLWEINGLIDKGYKLTSKGEDHILRALIRLEGEGREFCKRKGINFAKWRRENVNMVLVPANMR